MQTINNQILIPTITWVEEKDPEDNLLFAGWREDPARKQVINNSPLGEYAPDLPLIMVETPRNMTKMTSGSVYIAPETAAELARIPLEKVHELADTGAVRLARNNKGQVGIEKNDLLLWLFKQPVEWNGKQYRRDFAWSSQVKENVTIATETDFFAEQGIIRFAEDPYRIGRAYLPNCSAGSRGDLRVKLVKPGTVIPGLGPVDDGFGYGRQSLFSPMEKAGLRFQKVQAGKWQNSYSFMQRFTFSTELWKELEPHFLAGLKEVSADNSEFALLLRQKGCDIGAKTTFTEVTDMPEHPYIASALARTRARRMFTVATTGGFMMEGGLFVPTTSRKLVLPGEHFADGGEYIITRYPIDGPGSIRVVDTIHTGKEAKRIAGMEIVQYTLSEGYKKSFKGMLGSVPDELWTEDYDLVLCVEDEKLNADWHTKDDIDRSEKTYLLKDAVLSITQWYEAGAAIGVPGWLAKDLNADYDGDQGAVIRCADFPVLTRQAKALPQLPNPKLPKTKTPTTVGESRAYNALLSMANIVGIATNIVSTVLAVQDQEYAAKSLGWKNDDEMHEWFMFAIKLGTDIFKTTEDYRPVLKKLGQLNTQLGRLGVSAPWTRWDDDPKAFHHLIPMVLDPDNEERLTEWEQNNAILPADMAFQRQDGIIPQFLRFALPRMQLPDDAAIRPLAYYRDWAERPDEKMFETAKKLLNWYADRLQNVNFGIPKQWFGFVEKWTQAITWMVDKQSLDRWTLANAMWWCGHFDQRYSELEKMASAVFVGMPDEAERIAREKPGLSGEKAGEFEIFVTGLSHQLPMYHESGAEFITPINVVDFDDVRSGVKVRRRALVAEQPLEGQEQPKLEHYPRNMIAITAIQDFILPGKYQAEFRFIRGKRNGGSWQARLVNDNQ